jgi:acyl-CoA carboxylase subunit beta
MGEANGRRLEIAIQTASRLRLPFVSIMRTGGARMQEGMRSPLQMQRSSAALRVAVDADDVTTLGKQAEGRVGRRRL